jgi:hypothetical protein
MSPRRILLLALVVGAGRAVAAEAASTPAPGATAPASTRRSAPSSATAPAATATTPARPASSIAPTASFDTFRLVSERNIFNPNRSGRRERTVEEKAPKLDVISLVGTMESDRGLRAFFDGSDAGYRKALRVGESVDKFKVTQIAPNVVELERDGKTLSVRVGQQLRRPEGADWNLVGEDVVRREAQARAAADARPDPNAPPVIPAGASEIEKRMIERRMKELRR